MGEPLASGYRHATTGAVYEELSRLIGDRYGQGKKKLHKAYNTKM